MLGEKRINKTIYLHDIQHKIGCHVGANKNNISTVDAVACCLKMQKNILLTADDGYKSVQKLLPLLERFNVKLIFFITTGFVDRTEYPYEVLICNFLEDNSSCFYKGKWIDISTNGQKTEVFRSFHSKLKRRTYATRQRFLQDFFLDNSVDAELYKLDKFMSWEEVRDIASHPLVEIGSHSASHLFLPSQSLSVVWDELKASKIKLEQKLGGSVSKLSYPYGAHDRRVRLLARILGYEYAFGTSEFNRGSMALPRNSLR